MLLNSSSLARCLREVQTLGLIMVLMTGYLALTPVAQSTENPPNTLKGVPVPATPGLLDGRSPIIVDKQAAILLGKALFWDSTVGSDGMACATCHFHAGADRRVRNQLETGSRHLSAKSGNTFEPTLSGAAGGPNYALKASDFPMFKLSNGLDNHSAILFSTDDVVSSSGTFLASFKSTPATGETADECASENDTVFHQGALNTRRASTRNAPSIYNAAMNHRNFWDGRANHLFNGESAYGPRDPDAGIWMTKGDKTVQERLLLANASLASQAVAPPLDDREMSCQKRTMKEVARKLLQRRALERQAIHPDDSVLGASRDTSGLGLAKTYGDLIKLSFDKRFWSGNGDFGKTRDGQPYSQMEANFAFFFGLAIQLYEATLISDETRFDAPRDREGFPLAYNESEKRGLKVFTSECMLCHLGPTFTAAAHPQVYNARNAPMRLVDRRVINGDFDGSGVAYALIDIGYTNTSVTPTENDLGVGGTDPFGNPLSFTEQYVGELLDASRKKVDPVDVLSCYFTTGFTFDFKPEDLMLDTRGKKGCANYQQTSRIPKPEVMTEEVKKVEQGRLLAAVKGAFKVPGLRNVELTGPYMHNGSMKNLEEVLAFYDRGGNANNPHHIANLVFPRPFSTQEKDDLIAFLKTLTDERVRWERAPFDHPALDVPHGHTSTSSSPDSGRAGDEWIKVPAVGRQGRDETLGPLQPFETYLAPN